MVVVDDEAEAVGDGVGVGWQGGHGVGPTVEDHAGGSEEGDQGGPGADQSDGQGGGRGVDGEAGGGETGHGQGEDPVGVALDEDRGGHHGVVGSDLVTGGA